MSLLSGIAGALRTVGQAVLKTPVVGTLAKFIPGLGTAATVVGAYQAIKGIAGSAATTVMEHPAITGAVLGGTAGVIAGRASNVPPSVGGGLLSLPGGLATGGGVMPRSARGIMKSANYYARKYPQWAMSVGGTTGIANLIASGQLPAMRHRRGRGITPRDLRSFKRVANLINHFSRPVHHMRGYKKGGRHASV